MARRLASIALVLGAAAALATARSSDRAAAAAAPRLGEADVLELDLEFFRARVARDPLSARDHAQLARLHLQRARAGANPDADLARAESFARRSLALRAGRNAEAFQVLASSLMGQHRFAEARTSAERLVALDAAAPGARAMLGEILLELGDYDAARRTFGGLFTYRTDLAVAPRYARWEEIRGRPWEARRLLRLARAQAEKRHEMPLSQLAWFQWRLGDLAFRNGRLSEADRELQAGLAIAPDDHRLLDALARVAAVRGRWSDAIALGELAVARAPDPATLGLLHLCYEAIGERTRSEEYHRAMTVTALGQPDQFHRLWGLALLDAGREVPRVLARARQEVGSRRDVYAWDLLAWALHRSGKHAEARQAMARALSMGTRDAMLFYHAGMIDAALGQPATARRFLETALEINPHWHPLQPARTRRLLRLIGGR